MNDARYSADNSTDANYTNSGENNVVMQEVVSAVGLFKTAQFLLTVCVCVYVFGCVCVRLCVYRVFFSQINSCCCALICAFCIFFSIWYLTQIIEFISDIFHSVKLSNSIIFIWYIHFVCQINFILVRFSSNSCCFDVMCWCCCLCLLICVQAISVLVVVVCVYLPLDVYSEQNKQKNTCTKYIFIFWTLTNITTIFTEWQIPILHKYMHSYWFICCYAFLV